MRVFVETRSEVSAEPVAPYDGVVRSGMPPLRIDWPEGTAAGQANRMSYVEGTIAGSANAEINLAAVAAPSGGNHAFTSVRRLVLTTTGPVTLEPADANGWTAIGTIAARERVELTSAAGYPVGASDRVLKITNGGASAVNYKLELVGALSV